MTLDSPLPFLPCLVSLRGDGASIVGPLGRAVPLDQQAVLDEIRGLPLGAPPLKPRLTDHDAGLETRRSNSLK